MMLELLDERTPEVGWRRVASVLLAGLAIIVAVNLAVTAGFSQVTVNRGYDTIRLKWDSVADQDEPVDWLLLGDSTCNQGLDPQVFADHADLTALNLCTTGNMIVVGDVWFLEEYLREVGPPRSGILVTHAYDVWHRDQTELEAISWVIPAGDSWRRGRSLVPASPEERLTALAGPYLPLYVQPTSSLELLTNPTSVADRPAPNLTDLGFRQAGPSDVDEVERDARRHLNFVENRDATPSAINIAALDELRRLAATHDLPLVFVSPPVLEELWEDETFRAAYRDATQHRDEVAASDPVVHILRRDPWTYPAEVLQNADHLAELPAQVHTATVLDAMAEAGLIGSITGPEAERAEGGD